MASDEQIKEIISTSHRENQNAKELKSSLNQLLELRRELYLDHPWCEKVDSLIYNAALRLQLKIQEDSSSFWSVFKNEILKALLPFALGLIFAYYGLKSTP